MLWKNVLLYMYMLSCSRLLHFTWLFFTFYFGAAGVCSHAQNTRLVVEIGYDIDVVETFVAQISSRSSCVFWRTCPTTKPCWICSTTQSTVQRMSSNSWQLTGRRASSTHSTNTCSSTRLCQGFENMDGNTSTEMWPVMFNRKKPLHQSNDVYGMKNALVSME